MAQNKSPDGTFPSFPQSLPVDGETVNEDWLCVSATSNRGTLGKLIDAVGYLYARSPQLFRVASDGLGSASFSRRTPITDGTTAFFSSVTTAAGYLQLNYGTALASASDAVVFVSAQSVVGGSASDWIAQVESYTTTYVRIRVWDTGSAAAVDLTSTAVTFQVAVFPNLAGYT